MLEVFVNSSVPPLGKTNPIRIGNETSSVAIPFRFHVKMMIAHCCGRIDAHMMLKKKWIRKLSKKIAVAMSGGVDSACVAMLLKEAGHDVIGVFMKNWDNSEEDEKKNCFVDRDREHMKQVCKRLDIPAHEVEFIKEYWVDVFSPFLESYRGGIKTPNPDVFCNRHIKFNCFIDHVQKRYNVDLIATGHYARLAKGIDGVPQLLRAADKTKDQSYFLSMISGKSLQNVIFPLGDLRKSQVRALVAERLDGLDVLTKDESMGVCFIGKRNLPEFLGQYFRPTPGRYIDMDTLKPIGTHAGKEFLTVGQGARIGGLREKYFIATKTLPLRPPGGHCESNKEEDPQGPEGGERFAQGSAKGGDGDGGTRGARGVQRIMGFEVIPSPPTLRTFANRNFNDDEENEYDEEAYGGHGKGGSNHPKGAVPRTHAAKVLARPINLKFLPQVVRRSAAAAAAAAGAAAHENEFLLDHFGGGHHDGEDDAKSDYRTSRTEGANKGGSDDQLMKWCEGGLEGDRQHQAKDDAENDGEHSKGGDDSMKKKRKNKKAPPAPYEARPGDVYVCKGIQHPALFSDHLLVQGDEFSWVGGSLPLELAQQLERQRLDPRHTRGRREKQGGAKEVAGEAKGVRLNQAKSKRASAGADYWSILDAGIGSPTPKISDTNANAEPEDGDDDDDDDADVDADGELFDDESGLVFRCLFKPRYRQAANRCRVEVRLRTNGYYLKVFFDDPHWAITPGQILVLYKDEVCLGGGPIHRAGCSYWAREKALPPISHADYGHN